MTTVDNPPAQPASLLDIDAGTWRTHAGRAAFLVRHHLVGHPLLTHESVAALAGRLPLHDVESFTDDLPRVFDSDEVGALDRPPEELARRVVELRRWVGLHYIEQDEAYRDMVGDCIGDVTRAVVGWREQISRPEGYIFLSPPGSVTPAHVDHEHNFLLQVEGTKTMTIGFLDPDREERLLESMYDGHYGRTDALPDECESFVLEPGTGVYVPPRSVHLVENHNNVSISFSLVFHAPSLDREALVYAFNAKARRLGLEPRHPGRSLHRDRAKAAAIRLWRRRPKGPDHSQCAPTTADR